MRRILRGYAALIVVWVVMAGTAAAQPVAPLPTPTPPSTPAPTAGDGGLTQPYATVITGALAVLVAVIALVGVLLTRRQADRHFAEKQEQDRTQFGEQQKREREQFARTHELDRIRGLRERYTTCAEQLAHTNPAVRQAGVYALAALADDWNSSSDGLHEETQVCLDLLCAYLRSSREPGDREVRSSVTAVIHRHAKLWAGYAYDLTDANLTDANLTGVNLTGANLSGVAILSDADLTAAKLTGVNLSNANLTGANLFRANLTGVIFLTDAKLTDANLSRANLSRANLFRANLFRANLAGADLFRVNLAGADLSRTNLTGADLSRVTWDIDTKWPEGFTPPGSADRV